jgi:signal transduction histidine kinase
MNMANHISPKYTENKHLQAKQHNLRGWYLRNIRFPNSYFNTTVQLYEKRLAEKDRLIGTMVHDIKNPMYSLFGFSKLLEQEPDRYTEEERKNMIRMIFQTSELMIGRINEILDWSRLRQGAVKVALESLDVHGIVGKAHQLYSSGAKSKGITIINLVPHETMVLADKEMLQQIIENLISNSIKFCSKGGAIEVAAVRSGKEVSIIVKDNGIGISRENIAKIMDPDVPFTRPGTANEEGTGLGMKRAIEMAKAQNGRLQVYSEGEGKGTKVLITLPVAQT